MNPSDKALQSPVPEGQDEARWRGLFERESAGRKAAEAAQAESERRYRALFESIDEGFAIVQVILDAEGRPCDYRFLEVNPAFARQTGLPDAVGRTILQLVPDIERFYIETYGRVALTGESIR